MFTLKLPVAYYIATPFGNRGRTLTVHEHSPNAKLLLELLATVSDGHTTPLEALRHLRVSLPKKEQRLIDIALKFYEIRILLDELQECECK